jgi:hypothetical protein
MKKLLVKYQETIKPEKPFFGPQMDEEQRLQIINDPSNPLTKRFEGINSLSIDGFVEDEGRGLYLLDEEDTSAFLEIMSALFPKENYFLFGYHRNINENNQDVADVVETAFLEKMKYSPEGAECQPIFSNITDLQKMIELVKKGGSDLITPYFQGICIFGKDAENVMDTGFWQKNAELDLNDPYFQISNIPQLLENCQRVIYFHEGETHQYPAIYGRNIAIEKKKGIIRQICEKNNFGYEEVGENKNFL